MFKKQIIIVVVIVLGVAAALYFYFDRHQEVVITPVANNSASIVEPISSTQENINSQPDNNPEEIKPIIKSDQVIKNGKRVTYKSPDLGIEFTYNSEAYTSPKIETSDITEDGVTTKNVRQLWLRDNTSDPPFPEAPSIYLYKIPGYQNYIDDQKAKLSEYEGCKVLSETNIDGAPAIRYQCPGMGDEETVIIKTWSHHVIIKAVFTGQNFDEFLRSIKVYNNY